MAVRTPKRLKEGPGSRYLDAAHTYAAKVVSGDQPANNHVQLACKQFLEDVKSARLKSFPYVLDGAAAARACEFIELCPLSKGDGARERKRLILQPWQAFLVVNIFGWLKKSDRTRRYREVYLKVPRKNGKSELAAAIALYCLLADGEWGGEVFCGGKNEAQARKVFEAACRMVWNTPPMQKALGVDVGGSKREPFAVFQEDTFSRMEPIVFERGDGDAPSVYVCDEYHEHRDDRQYDTMRSGMGSRKQPLILITTTAGFSIGGACYNYEDDALKVLEGTTERPDLFVLAYGVDPEDDWQSREAYEKANPNIDVSVSREFLEKERVAAIARPQKSGIYKTKHLNLWANAAEAYFDAISWRELGNPTLSPGDLQGLRVWAGLDMAIKRDFCALLMLAERDDGSFVAIPRLWLPEGTLETKHETVKQLQARHPDNPPIIVTDGDTIDYEQVQEEIEELHDQLAFEALAFDRAHAGMLALKLENYGVPTLEFSQTARNMNEPMKALDKLIADGRIAHDGNPVMGWMMSNVVRRTSTRLELDYPDRNSVEKNIDGPVALMFALGVQSYAEQAVELTLTRLR